MVLAMEDATMWIYLWALGCSSSTDDTMDEAQIGDPELAQIVLQVSYEPGAEPYTGPGLLGGDTWSLFRTNASALFEGTGVTVSSPDGLDQVSTPSWRPSCTKTPALRREDGGVIRTRCGGVAEGWQEHRAGELPFDRMDRIQRQKMGWQIIGGPERGPSAAGSCTRRTW